MKLFLRILVLVFLIVSCKSQKNTNGKIKEKYLKAGYTVGKIEPMTSGKCSIIITVNDLQYDPVNISDEKFSKFTNKRTLVYFKYLPLRMQNRCSETSPISIIDMVEY